MNARNDEGRGSLCKTRDTVDQPDSPEDAVVEEDEGGHGSQAGGQELSPVYVVPDVVGVVA